MSLTRPREPLSAVLGALRAASYLAALTLIGAVIHDDVAESHASSPDTPPAHPDPPSGPGAA